MGTMFNDHTRGGAGVRASGRRVTRRYLRYAIMPPLPPVKAGWGEVRPHEGIILRVLDAETVEVREHGTARTWRLSIGQLSR
jgi:hypothetical protein